MSDSTNYEVGRLLKVYDGWMSRGDTSAAFNVVMWASATAEAICHLHTEQSFERSVFGC